MPVDRARPTGSVQIAFHVQPRASRNEVTGLVGDAVRVRLTAPPVEGAANEALVAFVAERLGLPRRQVQLVAGQTSRHKRLVIHGVAEHDAVVARLLAKD